MIILNLNPNDNIQDVIDSYLPDEMLEIHLAPGTYHQTLIINHNHLKIIGSNSLDTIIEFDNYSYKMHADGLLYNTFRSSVVTILSDDVELQSITIKNASGSGLTIGQAVALSVYGNKTNLNHCRLLGHQDTLFIGPLPVDLTERYDVFLPIEQRLTNETFTKLNECYIEGDVDFIFGSGTALFNHCTIVALTKGFITAPSTYKIFQYGFIFMNCELISKSNNPDVYLARPWRDHGSTIFINCSFTGNFSKIRYDAWDKTYMRFFEYPYVDSSLSNPLLKEDVKQLKEFILHHSIASQND